MPYPLQILGLGPVAFLACHMVSQLSLARGGARSRVKSAPSSGLTRKEQADRRVSSLLDLPAMRLLWGLIWMSNFFALSLQKPRSWRKDTVVLERDRAGDGRAGVGDLIVE